MRKVKKFLKKYLPDSLYGWLKLKNVQGRQAKRDFKRWRKTGYISLVDRYNLYDKYQVVYIDIPKVASTSIMKLILDQYQLWDANLGDGSLVIRKYAHQLNHQHFRIERKVAVESKYFVFSIVRNPFARLVSLHNNLYKALDETRFQIYDVYGFGYLSRKKGIDQDFHRFVNRIIRVPDAFAERHFISQYALLYDQEGQPKADFVGKMENLEEDWKIIQERTGLPDLPHHNASQNKQDNWMDYYTLDLAHKVYKRYQQDIEAFGYQEIYDTLLDYLKNKG